MSYLVFDTLHNTHPRLLLLFAVPNVERHRAVVLGDLEEEVSARLHLQQVGQPGLLEYCRLRIFLLVLAVPGADQHIHGVHLVQTKLVGLAVLALRLARAVVDGLLAVDDVLLEVVGHHSLNWLREQN